MIAITATDVQTKFNIPIKWLLMVTLYVHCLSYFNNQLNAQILLFYNNMYVTLQSSICFEH